MGFPLKSSWRFVTNALDISYRTKVAQNKRITHINILEQPIIVAHANFLLEI